MHKEHSCQVAVHEIVGPVISGVINFALSMRGGGAVASLRKAVRLLLQARLKVYRGAHPPDRGRGSLAWEYRNAVLHLFLGSADEGARGRRRTLILAEVLNGNWLLRDRVEHYCPGPQCCRDEEDTMNKCCEFVVHALLPAACPVLQRSRWTRSNLAQNYTGLFAACHGILFAVVHPWLREQSDPTKPMLMSDFEVDDSDSDEDLGPRGVQEMLMDVDPGDAEEVVDDPMASAEVAIVPVQDRLLDGDFNKERELNRKARVGTKEFVELPNLRCDLALLRQCAEPHHRMVCRILRVSSDKWEQEQHYNILHGQRPQPRLLQYVTGALTDPLLEDIEYRLFSCTCWGATPPSERSLASNVKAFKMLSCGAGAAEALIVHPMTKTYPYKLFRGVLLAEKFEDDTDEVALDGLCWYDPFTADHKAKHPGEEVHSEQSHIELTAVAEATPCDIVAIEARHGTLRRLLLRSIQTWSKPIEEVAADWSLLRHRVLRQHPGLIGKALQRRRLGRPPVQRVKRTRKRPVSTKPRAVKHRAKQTAKGKGQPGASSIWKAFWSEECKGKRGLPTAAERAEMRKKYKELTPAVGLRLARVAGARSTTNRAKLDPAAQEIVRQHQLSTCRVLAVQDVDPVIAGEQTLATVSRLQGSLQDKLKSLRRGERQLSAQNALVEASRYQGLRDDLACLPVPRLIAEMSWPPQIKPSLVVMPSTNFHLEKVELRAAVCDFAEHVLQHAPADLLKDLRADWAQQHVLRQHSEAAALPPEDGARRAAHTR